MLARRTTLGRALGEVAMIVVGVLLALAASDWQERRSDRRREIDVLRGLSAALETDLALLDGQIQRYRTIQTRDDRVTIEEPERL